MAYNPKLTTWRTKNPTKDVTSRFDGNSQAELQALDIQEIIDNSKTTRLINVTGGIKAPNRYEKFTDNHISALTSFYGNLTKNQSPQELMHQTIKLDMQRNTQKMSRSRASVADQINSFNKAKNIISLDLETISGTDKYGQSSLNQIIEIAAATQEAGISKSYSNIIGVEADSQLHKKLQNFMTDFKNHGITSEEQRVALNTLATYGHPNTIVDMSKGVVSRKFADPNLIDSMDKFNTEYMDQGLKVLNQAHTHHQQDGFKTIGKTYDDIFNLVNKDESFTMFHNGGYADKPWLDLAMYSGQGKGNNKFGFNYKFNSGFHPKNYIDTRDMLVAQGMHASGRSMAAGGSPLSQQSLLLDMFGSTYKEKHIAIEDARDLLTAMTSDHKMSLKTIAGKAQDARGMNINLDSVYNNYLFVPHTTNRFGALNATRDPYTGEIRTYGGVNTATGELNFNKAFGPKKDVAHRISVSKVGKNDINPLRELFPDYDLENLYMIKSSAYAKHFKNADDLTAIGAHEEHYEFARTLEEVEQIMNGYTVVGEGEFNEAGKFMPKTFSEGFVKDYTTTSTKTGLATTGKEVYDNFMTQSIFKLKNDSVARQYRELSLKKLDNFDNWRSEVSKLSGKGSERDFIQAQISNMVAKTTSTGKHIPLDKQKAFMQISKSTLGFKDRRGGKQNLLNNTLSYNAEGYDLFSGFHDQVVKPFHAMWDASGDTNPNRKQAVFEEYVDRLANNIQESNQYIEGAMTNTYPRNPYMHELNSHVLDLSEIGNGFSSEHNIKFDDKNNVYNLIDASLTQYGVTNPNVSNEMKLAAMQKMYGDLSAINPKYDVLSKNASNRFASAYDFGEEFIDKLSKNKDFTGKTVNYTQQVGIYPSALAERLGKMGSAGAVLQEDIFKSANSNVGQIYNISSENVGKSSFNHQIEQFVNNVLIDKNQIQKDLLSRHSETSDYYKYAMEQVSQASTEMVSGMKTFVGEVGSAGVAFKYDTSAKIATLIAGGHSVNLEALSMLGAEGGILHTSVGRTKNAINFELVRDANNNLVYKTNIGTAFDKRLKYFGNTIKSAYEKGGSVGAMDAASYTSKKIAGDLRLTSSITQMTTGELVKSLELNNGALTGYALGLYKNDPKSFQKLVGQEAYSNFGTNFKQLLDSKDFNKIRTENLNSSQKGIISLMTGDLIRHAAPGVMGKNKAKFNKLFLNQSNITNENYAHLGYGVASYLDTYKTSIYSPMQRPVILQHTNAMQFSKNRVEKIFNKNGVKNVRFGSSVSDDGINKLGHIAGEDTVSTFRVKQLNTNEVSFKNYIADNIDNALSKHDLTGNYEGAGQKIKGIISGLNIYNDEQIIDARIAEAFDGSNYQRLSLWKDLVTNTSTIKKLNSKRKEGIKSINDLIPDITIDPKSKKIIVTPKGRQVQMGETIASHFGLNNDVSDFTAKYKGTANFGWFKKTGELVGHDEFEAIRAGNNITDKQGFFDHMNKKYDSYLYLENEGRRTFIKGAGVDEKGMMSQAVAGLGELDNSVRMTLEENGLGHLVGKVYSPGMRREMEDHLGITATGSLMAKIDKEMYLPAKILHDQILGGVSYVTGQNTFGHVSVSTAVNARLGLIADELDLTNSKHSELFNTYKSQIFKGINPDDIDFKSNQFLINNKGISNNQSINPVAINEFASKMGIKTQHAIGDLGFGEFGVMNTYAGGISASDMNDEELSKLVQKGLKIDSRTKTMLEYKKLGSSEVNALKNIWGDAASHLSHDGVNNKYLFNTMLEDIHGLNVNDPELRKLGALGRKGFYAQQFNENVINDFDQMEKRGFKSASFSNYEHPTGVLGRTFAEKSEFFNDSRSGTLFDMGENMGEEYRYLATPNMLKTSENNFIAYKSQEQLGKIKRMHEAYNEHGISEEERFRRSDRLKTGIDDYKLIQRAEVSGKEGFLLKAQQPRLDEAFHFVNSGIVTPLAEKDIDAYADNGMKSALRKFSQSSYSSALDVAQYKGQSIASLAREGKYVNAAFAGRNYFDQYLKTDYLDSLGKDYFNEGRLSSLGIKANGRSKQAYMEEILEKHGLPYMVHRDPSIQMNSTSGALLYLNKALKDNQIQMGPTLQKAINSDADGDLILGARMKLRGYYKNDEGKWINQHMSSQESTTSWLDHIAGLTNENKNVNNLYKDFDNGMLDSALVGREYVESATKSVIKNALMSGSLDPDTVSKLSPTRMVNEIYPSLRTSHTQDEINLSQAYIEENHFGKYFNKEKTKISDVLGFDDKINELMSTNKKAGNEAIQHALTLSSQGGHDTTLMAKNFKSAIGEINSPLAFLREVKLATEFKNADQNREAELVIGKMLEYTEQNSISAKKATAIFVDQPERIKTAIGRSMNKGDSIGLSTVLKDIDGDNGFFKDYGMFLRDNHGAFKGVKDEKMAEHMINNFTSLVETMGEQTRSMRGDYRAFGSMAGATAAQTGGLLQNTSHNSLEKLSLLQSVFWHEQNQEIRDSLNLGEYTSKKKLTGTSGRFSEGAAKVVTNEAGSMSGILQDAIKTTASNVTNAMEHAGGGTSLAMGALGMAGALMVAGFVGGNPSKPADIQAAEVAESDNSGAVPSFADNTQNTNMTGPQTGYVVNINARSKGSNQQVARIIHSSMQNGFNTNVNVALNMSQDAGNIDDRTLQQWISGALSL